MANIISITKPTGEIRICIDFRDINNAYPKDDPKPPINLDLNHKNVLLVLLQESYWAS